MLRKLHLALALILASNYAFAQGRELLNEIIKKSHNGESYYADQELFVKQNSTLEPLTQIETQLTNENSNIRYLLFNLIYQVGFQSTNSDVRERAVYLLIDNGLADAEQSLIGRNIELLSEFPSSDFSQQSRARLAAVVMNSKSYVTDLIRLSGQIKLTSLTTFFEQRLATTKNTKEIWPLHCALARMHDITQKAYCFNRVKRMGINDQVIQYAIPDLLYTQNKDAIDYLLETILVDNMNCSSFNPDSSEMVNCAYRLIELVAPFVNNFPVKVGASGDLEVASYEKALVDVRQWIVANKTTYQVNF